MLIDNVMAMIECVSNVTIPLIEANESTWDFISFYTHFCNLPDLVIFHFPPFS